MEALVASAIGVLTACGVYLILRLRVFAAILGISLLSYAVNVFLFSTGRLATGAAPILDKYAENPVYTDPLPQALVLTAIVISFGMTAVLVMFTLGAYLEAGHDRIDMDEVEPDIDDPITEGIALDMSAEPAEDRT
ncbi:Na+/H+ antiporter subunit C [Pacificoceanicola onchidii]|uniref:Na+/H+ antiporter subunit C n=1 Tax=Pacificoceanicola onchidii TaxID=2562685 RepID=UPI0010A5BE0D|nr:Na+/H+ antiporter subunit C [Pacificoceanicola onchidii]